MVGFRTSAEDGHLVGTLMVGPHGVPHRMWCIERYFGMSLHRIWMEARFEDRI